MFNWKDITMAGIIILSIIFYTCKKSTLQASITSPENKVSNFIIPNSSSALFASNNLKTNTTTDSKINWISFDEAYASCKKNPKPIIVNVYISETAPCDRMNTETFCDSSISNYINKNYYAVKFDAESTDTVKFGEYVFVNSNVHSKSTHQFAVSILDNQLEFPSLVFLNNQAKRLDIIKGFIPSNTLVPILSYYGSGEYQKIKWEAYQKEFLASVK